MTRLSVPDMNCGHCKASVEAAIARIDEKATVKVDLDARVVEVESAATAPALIAALAGIGFPATVT